MARRTKLSDGTVNTALAAIEDKISGGKSADMNETQALYDARKELMALGGTSPAAKPKPRAARAAIAPSEQGVS